MTIKAASSNSHALLPLSPRNRARVEVGTTSRPEREPRECDEMLRWLLFFKAAAGEAPCDLDALERELRMWKHCGALSVLAVGPSKQPEIMTALLESDWLAYIAIMNPPSQAEDSASRRERGRLTVVGSEFRFRWQVRVQDPARQLDAWRLEQSCRWLADDEDLLVTRASYDPLEGTVHANIESGRNGFLRFAAACKEGPTSIVDGCVVKSVELQFRFRLMLRRGAESGGHTTAGLLSALIPQVGGPSLQISSTAPGDGRSDLLAANVEATWADWLAMEQALAAPGSLLGGQVIDADLLFTPEFVDSFQDADERLLRWFLRRHGSDLQRGVLIVLRKLRHQLEADELFNVVWLHFVQRAVSIFGRYTRHAGKKSKYFSSIAIKRALDFWRAERNQRSVPVDEPDHDAKGASGASAESTATERKGNKPNKPAARRSHVSIAAPGIEERVGTSETILLLANHATADELHQLLIMYRKKCEATAPKHHRMRQRYRFMIDDVFEGLTPKELMDAYGLSADGVTKERERYLNDLAELWWGLHPQSSPRGN